MIDYNRNTNPDYIERMRQLYEKFPIVHPDGRNEEHPGESVKLTLEDLMERAKLNGYWIFDNGWEE